MDTRFEPISPANRAEVNGFIREHWHSTDMVLGGQVVDMTRADGVIARDAQGIAGAITWRIGQDHLEILSLDSLREATGLGTALIGRAIDAARTAGCARIRLITTNDNTAALRFYQRRGFDIIAVHFGAVDRARQIKPSIPMLGNDGIPLRHEIELELTLPPTPDGG